MPLIDCTRQVVLKLIDRFPYVIYAGGARLEKCGCPMGLKGLHLLYGLITAGCALMGTAGGWRGKQVGRGVDLLDVVSGKSY